LGFCTERLRRGRILAGNLVGIAVLGLNVIEVDVHGFLSIEMPDRFSARSTKMQVTDELRLCPAPGFEFRGFTYFGHPAV